MRLQNDVAIITGAASGMGREMAKLFALKGAKVVAADLNDRGVNELIGELNGAGEVAFFKADVSDRNNVEQMIDFAISRYGKLDILVNNAGIMDDMMPVTEVEDDLWRRVMEINLYGVMYACRYAIPRMIDAGGGRIINIASVGGLNGSRAGVAYTAAKHGVVGLTKNIGFMYAEKGIRCNAIAPGGVRTNIGAGMKNVSQFGIARASACAATMPREAEAAEIAQIALFLAGDASSFVNGTVIVADGGWTAY